MGVRKAFEGFKGHLVTRKKPEVSWKFVFKGRQKGKVHNFVERPSPWQKPTTGAGGSDHSGNFFERDRKFSLFEQKVVGGFAEDLEPCEYPPTGAWNTENKSRTPRKWPFVSTGNSDSYRVVIGDKGGKNTFRSCMGQSATQTFTENRLRDSARVCRSMTNNSCHTHSPTCTHWSTWNIVWEQMSTNIWTGKACTETGAK